MVQDGAAAAEWSRCPVRSLIGTSRCVAAQRFRSARTSRSIHKVQSLTPTSEAACARRRLKIRARTRAIHLALTYGSSSHALGTARRLSSTCAPAGSALSPAKRATSRSCRCMFGRPHHPSPTGGRPGIYGTCVDGGPRPCVSILVSNSIVIGQRSCGASQSVLSGPVARPICSRTTRFSVAGIRAGGSDD